MRSCGCWKEDIRTHILSSWREVLQHYGHHPLTGKCTLSNYLVTICRHTLYLLVYTQIGYLCSLQKFQGPLLPSFSLASSSAWQLQRVVLSFHSAFPSHLVANWYSIAMHVAVFWSQASIQKLAGTNFLSHTDYSLVLDSHLLRLDSVHCQHRNHVCFQAKHQRQFK